MHSDTRPGMCGVSQRTAYAWHDTGPPNDSCANSLNSSMKEKPEKIVDGTQKKEAAQLYVAVYGVIPVLQIAQNSSRKFGIK